MLGMWPFLILGALAAFVLTGDSDDGSLIVVQDGIQVISPKAKMTDGEAKAFLDSFEHYGLPTDGVLVTEGPLKGAIALDLVYSVPTLSAAELASGKTRMGRARDSIAETHPGSNVVSIMSAADIKALIGGAHPTPITTYVTTLKVARVACAPGSAFVALPT